MKAPVKTEPAPNRWDLLALSLSGGPGLAELPEAGGECLALYRALVTSPGSPLRAERCLALEGEGAARGRILRESRQAPEALALVVGAAVWLEGAAFLVPGDVYDLEDPAALVPLQNWPGPLLADLWVIEGKEDFAQWLQSEGPQPSLVRLVERREDFLDGKLPGRSRWAEALIQALDGSPEALEADCLTFSGLRRFFAAQGLEVYGRGELQLADHSGGILDPLGLMGAPLVAFGAEAERSLRVKEVLTEIKHWQAYTQTQIEWSVNHNLGPYLADELGRKAARLRKALGFALGELEAEGSQMNFPQGIYKFEYRAQDKKQGQLVETLWLEKDWAAKPEGLAQMIEALDLDYGALLLGLGGDLSPKALIPGLNAKGWDLLRETEDEVQAFKGGLELRADAERIRLFGAPLSRLLGSPEGSAGLKELLALL